MKSKKKEHAEIRNRSSEQRKKDKINDIKNMLHRLDARYSSAGLQERKKINVAYEKLKNELKVLEGKK